MNQNYLTLEEAARHLGVSTDELSRLRERGDIRAFNDGGTWMFRHEDVKEAAGNLINEDSVVLSDELDVGPHDPNAMRTILGGEGDSPSGKVVLDSDDESVFQARPNRMNEPGNSRTFVGAMDVGESAVHVQAKDKSADRPMQNIPNPSAPGGGSGIGKIPLEISETGDDGGMVLDGDLEMAHSDPETGTVLGQSGLPRNADGSIMIETHEEPALDDGQIELGRRVKPIDAGDANRTVIGVDESSSDSDVHLVVRGEQATNESLKITPMPRREDKVVAPQDATSASGNIEDTMALGEEADIAIDDDSMSVDLGGDTDIQRHPPGSFTLDDSEEPTLSPAQTAGMGGFGADEDLTLDLGVGGMSDVMDDDDEMLLGADAGGSDITISSSQSGLGGGGMGAADSGLSLEQPLDLQGMEGGSGIDLEAEDDEDEYVLSHGSDITRRPGESGICICAGESGIALAGLADSGISLETPLDLGSGASGIGAGGDFLLTPVDEGDGDDSDDSGSQVIALDAEAEGFNEHDATMLGPDDGGGVMLEPDYAGMGMPSAAGVATMPAPTRPMGAMPGAGYQQPQPQMGLHPGMQQMPVIQQVPSLPFSGLQVTALTFCLIFLILSGMMMFDLVTNMWSWEGVSSSYTSSIMDWVLKQIEGK